MHPLFYVAGFVLLGIAAMAIILPLRKKAKLTRKIKAAFGNPPGQEPNINVAEGFWHSTKGAAGYTHTVDDLTWFDLDLDEVYTRLNACQSSFGDIRLYASLRAPCQTASRAPTREATMATLAQNDAQRLALQLQLAGLGRSGGYALDTPISHPEIMRLQHKTLYRLLAFLPLACLGLCFLSPIVGVALAVVSMVVNYALGSHHKQTYANGFEAVQYLSSAIGAAAKIAKTCAGTLPEMGRELEENAAALKAQVGKSLSLLAMDEYINEVLQLPSPFGFFLLPLLSYGKLITRLAALHGPLLAFYEALGELDLCISLLSARQSLPLWCKPEYTEDASLTVTGLVHPLIDEPIPNSGSFTQGMLLTGSNASGKSTFIKAVALSCITAQGLNTCFAQQMRLKPGAVASSMAIQDNVIDGDSYFIAEIKSMRRLFRMASTGTFCYFFIDEILRGTNTVERIAAAAAVLRDISRLPCLCFAATHDIELTDLLSGRYTNYHFSEQIEAKQVVFDYQLKPGPATGRNALALLQSYGFPEATVATAKQLVARFESGAGWRLP